LQATALLILLFTPLPIFAQSQGVIRLSGSEKLDGRKILFLEDRDGLDPAAVLKPENRTRFSNGKSLNPAFGFTKASVWVVLELASDNDESWFIEVEEPLLHSVELFSAARNGTLSVQRAGRLIPFSQREVRHRKLLFPVLLTKDPQTFLLRIHSRDNVVVPLKVWTQRDLFIAEVWDQLRLGMFYGTILALIAYNAFLGLSLRDINYVYYVLYGLSFALFQSTVDGLAFALSPVESAWLNWRLPIFSGLITGIWLLMFCGSFLRLRLGPRLLHYSQMGLVVAAMTLFVLAIFETTMPAASQVSNILSAVTVFFSFSAAVYRTAAGYRTARFFLAGWLMFLTGVLAASLVNLGFIEYSATTKSWVRIGFLAEMLLFSFALADRINQLRREREEADQRALRAQEQVAADLDSLVQVRTSELRLANATKDRFFSIIAHDLRGPIGTLSALFHEAIDGDGRINPSTLAAIRMATTSTHGLLEDLLTWARSQLGEMVARPEYIDLALVAKRSIEVLETSAQAKAAEISLTSIAAPIAYADESMTALVLRNLLGNAIKFTQNGGKIRVSIVRDGQFIRTLVADNGCGIGAELRESLFRIDGHVVSSPGTNGEKGSGLGLILCREFVEKNAGQIGVESEPGAGSTFWFTLPENP
jgi:signal transduction histidine kinase